VRPEPTGDPMPHPKSTIGKLKSQRGGFTLLELMVSIGVFILLAVILVSLLQAALNTWDAGTARKDVYERAQAVLTLLTRDLQALYVVDVEKPEDLALAHQLADALGGEIGCTRPISEENHWLPEELCIGLSGVQVKPDLYLGLGVSGQIQHVTGIRNAKVIAAVNKDENAPIFGVADFGIVGDLYDAVPKLIEELRRGSLLK
jgi:type II secretory pathway pseudopilin PulG